MGRRRTFVIVLMILLAVPLTAAITTTVRVFQVPPGAVTVMEASNAIMPLLTDQGSMTIQPYHRQITVQDRPEVVERAAAVMVGLTRSPAGFKIRVELIEASNEPVDSARQAQVDARVRAMFRYTSYRPLGSAIFEGHLGDVTGGEVGSGYRVNFSTSGFPSTASFPWGSSPPAEERIHLEGLTLSRTRLDANGVRSSQEVLKTSAQFGHGQRVILGASGSESSERALVLVLEALEVGES